MTWVLAYGFLALAVAAFLALLRMERGPSMLDRVVGLDVITATMLGTVVLVSVAFRRSDLVAVLIVLSVIGFVGSVSVARFASRESAEERRILSEEELAAVAARERRLADEDAPVHDPDAPRLVRDAGDPGAEPGADGAADVGSHDAPEQEGPEPR